MIEKVRPGTIEEQFLESQIETQEKISPKEREAISALEAGLHRFDAFMSSTEEGKNSKSAAQNIDLQEIKRKAGKALQVFFKTVKISAGVGVLALLIGGFEGVDIALDAYAGKEPASPETDVLHKHPTIAKIAEWYFGQNLVEIIEEYQKLAKSRVGGQMTPEEVAFRERISDNVFPGTQGEAPGKSRWKSTELGRLKEQFQNFDENTGRVSQGALEALPENDAYQQYIKTGTEVRSDMFRIYLGLAPHFDYVEDSPYKPTKAKNPDTRYKSFPAAKIIESIRAVGKDMKARDQLADENAAAYAATSFDALWAYTQEAKALPENAYAHALGRYMVDQGYDPERKERYISYYDIWDLDIKPFRLAGLDLNQYNFPFEVYGRIYESDLK